MRKSVLLVTVLTLGLLAGCITTTSGSATMPNLTTTPNPTIASSPTTTPSPAPTALSTAPSATTTPGTVACQAAPFGKVEGLPPVGDQDWVRGSADASITLIEYSDFQ